MNKEKPFRGIGNNENFLFLAFCIFLLLFFLLYFFLVSSSQAQNIVSSYAGNEIPGYVNGDTANARFNNPFGLCIDKSGNIFIADAGNHCIRKISPTGIVTTIAGKGVSGYVDGDSSIAKFNSPTAVCVDDTGNLFVADIQNHCIRKISVSGIVTTIAGSSSPGYVDGPSVSAKFNFPRGICADKTGNLYVSDSWNHRIRKISVTGIVTTLVGGGNNTGVGSISDYIDGNDTSARFYTPTGITIDNTGNIYVADAYNHRIRKINTLQQVSTIAGSGSTGPGNGGFTDGLASTALLNTPTEIFIDSAGKLYFSDTFNNRIRLCSGGFVTTIAGNGAAGLINGIDSLCEFDYPRGLTADLSGDKIYVSDFNNHTIRKITLYNENNSVENINKANDNWFEIYPNPNQGILYINIKNIKITLPLTIRVVDISGKQVYARQNIIDPNGLVEIPCLPDGVYFIKASFQNFSGVKKIVISND